MGRQRITYAEKMQEAIKNLIDVSGNNDSSASSEAMQIYVSANTRLDANSFGTDAYDEPTLKYKCNVEGSYKVTDANGNTTTEYLVQGLDYYERVVKILDTDDTAVASGAITVHF